MFNLLVSSATPTPVKYERNEYRMNAISHIITTLIHRLVLMWQLQSAVISAIKFQMYIVNQLTLAKHETLKCLKITYLKILLHFLGANELFSRYFDGSPYIARFFICHLQVWCWIVFVNRKSFQRIHTSYRLWFHIFKTRVDSFNFPLNMIKHFTKVVNLEMNFLHSLWQKQLP